MKILTILNAWINRLFGRDRLQHPQDTDTITVRFTGKSYDHILRLIEKTEADGYVDVFKQALALYDLAVDEIDEGGCIILQDKHGVQQKLNLSNLSVEE